VTFQIKDSLAVQFTKAPAIAIAGPSGSGKTESAMRLARGYLGPKKKFLLIDTEEKRALYKKARYQPWDWMDFQPPFTPERYVEALEAGKDYDAVITDSGSHEYSGPGGLQDIQMETLERMSKGNVDRMDALTAPSWKDAKQRHKSKLMSYLIRYPKLLIVCLRAEPKVKFVKDAKGKMQIVDAGYVPICEKMFMYEMLVGCMMTADNAGVPQHIKQLEKDLEPIFLAGKQIDEGTGERLAAWSADRATSAGPEPLPESEVVQLLATLDVKTIPDLKAAFEAACTRANKARDKSAKDRLVAKYGELKLALEAQQI
jgi:AAA domain